MSIKEELPFGEIALAFHSNFPQSLIHQYPSSIPIDAPSGSLKARIKQKRSIEATVHHALNLAETNENGVYDLASRIETNEEMIRLVRTYVTLQPQTKVLAMALDSLNQHRNNDIAQKYGVKRDTVAKSLSLYRGIVLEPEFLFPIGLKRMTRKTQNKIGKGRLRRMNTFTIMNIQYASARQLSEYDMRKMDIDESLIEQGYLLVVNSLTPSEERVLRRNPNFSSKLLKRFKRVYIHRDDLEEFRAIRGPVSNDLGLSSRLMIREYQRRIYTASKAKTIFEASRHDNHT